MKEYREGRDQAIDRWRSRQAEVVQEETVQYAESDLGELSAPTVGSDQPNGRIERA